MLRLRDIMTREVVTVTPELSLRDTMSLFATRHISGAPVVANGKVVGVVSLTDLAEFSASDPGVPTERPEQAEWGEWDRAGDAPEGDGPPSAFFAEMWGDAGADVGERIKTPEGPEWNVLEEHVVGEVMTRRVVALGGDTSVEYAAKFMRNLGIHRVLVMSDGAIDGIVSTSDISAAVADKRLTNRVYVFPSPAVPAPRRP